MVPRYVFEHPATAQTSRFPAPVYGPAGLDVRDDDYVRRRAIPGFPADPFQFSGWNAGGGPARPITTVRPVGRRIRGRDRSAPVADHFGNTDDVRVSHP